MRTGKIIRLFKKDGGAPGDPFLQGCLELTGKGRVGSQILTGEIFTFKVYFLAPWSNTKGRKPVAQTGLLQERLL